MFSLGSSPAFFQTESAREHRFRFVSASFRVRTDSVTYSLKCFVPAAAICTILVFGLWMPSHNAGSIIAFSALYGLFSGPYTPR